MLLSILNFKTYSCNSVLYVFDRLGGGEADVKDLMSHPFFKNINWQDLVEKKVSSFTHHSAFKVWSAILYSFFSVLSVGVFEMSSLPGTGDRGIFFSLTIVNI